MHTQIRMRIVIRILTLVQWGQTPLQVAEWRGHASIATLIRSEAKRREKQKEEEELLIRQHAAAAAEAEVKRKEAAKVASASSLYTPDPPPPPTYVYDKYIYI
jgi:hypothetical protein